MDLGLGIDEVMALTHGQFADRVRRLDTVERRREAKLEVMLASLTAMVANTGFRGWKEPRQPEEFMPSLAHKQAAVKPRRRTKRELRRKAESIRAAFNTFWGAPQ